MDNIVDYNIIIMHSKLSEPSCSFRSEIDDNIITIYALSKFKIGLMSFHNQFKIKRLLNYVENILIYGQIVFCTINYDTCRVPKLVSVKL